MTGPFFLGIDPGLSGAVAILDPDGNVHNLHSLPTIDLPGDGTITRRLHGADLMRLLAAAIPRDAEALCMIEDVNVWGSAGMVPQLAALYASKMVILAALDCFASRLEVRPVQPSVWKRFYGLKKPPAALGLSRSKVTAHVKAAAREKALELYPDARVAQVKDNDRAEALLIARYGREVWRTESGLFDAPLAPATSPQPKLKRAASRSDDFADIPLG